MRHVRHARHVEPHSGSTACRPHGQCSLQLRINPFKSTSIFVHHLLFHAVRSLEPCLDSKGTFCVWICASVVEISLCELCVLSTWKKLMRRKKVQMVGTP